jgi:hypothetical protein
MSLAKLGMDEDELYSTLLIKNKSRKACINNNDKSTKHKNLYLLWVILGVLLDTSGLIVIVGFIFLGALLIIFHPIFN